MTSAQIPSDPAGTPLPASGSRRIGDHANWRDKLALGLLSLGAIWAIVGEWMIVPFLLGVSVATYVLIVAADLLVGARPWRIAVAIILSSAFFGALLSLNLAGIVGNLTGNPYSESLRNQWVVTLGIGFYTLQIIGVTVDVMRRRVAMPPLIDYIFYILYIPKFLSGPIEQATFLDRVHRYRLRYVDDNLWVGVPWLVLGAFMKFGIADSVSRLVDIDYVRPLGLVVMTALFELRVYFDWLGYSLMAYGAAWCLNLPVMLNFAQPLFAHNPQGLWRRWHISLGRWFHEYLYTPLRNGVPYPMLISFLAPVLVFTISATWHGASVNFLLWGVFHAAAYLLFVKVLRHVRTPKLIGIAGFVLLLLIGRLLFMDDNTERLFAKIGNLVSAEAWSRDLDPVAIDSMADHFIGMELTKAGLVGVLAAVAFIFAEWVNEKRHGDRPYHLFTGPAVAVLLTALTLLLISAADVGFVYARG